MRCEAPDRCRLQVPKAVPRNRRTLRPYRPVDIQPAMGTNIHGAMGNDLRCDTAGTA